MSARPVRLRGQEPDARPLQAERLRQWDGELAARDALLRHYLQWARKSGVKPLSRRGCRRLGIEGLYRRRDRFWLVAQGVGATSRGVHPTTIAGVYASGETVVRGLKAHQLAECLAERVDAAGRPWDDDDWAACLVGLEHPVSQARVRPGSP